MSEVSEQIKDYITSLYGKSSTKQFFDFIREEPAQYIRVNLLKTNPAELSDLLYKNYSIRTEAVPNIPFALKITAGKEHVSKTIEHITGLYYMQGLSSMIPPLILNPSSEDIVLDLCSAPGSKTTELCEIMQNKGTLVANEISINRVKMLVYNLDRMNIVNAGVLHQKGELLSKVYDSYFDKVLVDAPCSGLGIIQKNDEVSKWWSIEKAGMFGEIQLKLLIAAIKMVKEGGEIVYSTCTLTPEENEFVIQKLIKKYPVEIAPIDLPVSSIEGLSSYKDEQINKDLQYSRRILPWEVDSDGFFIVKLKKTGETPSQEPTEIHQKHTRLIPFNKDMRKLLKNITNDFGIEEEILSQYNYIQKQNDIFFINKDWYDPNPGMFERIGTKFGTIDHEGKVVLNTQAAEVLEKFISKNIYEIKNQDELKKYLDGGIIKSGSKLRGQCAIRFNNNILGTAVYTGAGIKSRFPRAKRTQEIIKEF